MKTNYSLILERNVSVNLEFHFSNSLIIHQAKTKQITTVKEVLIPGLN